MKTIVTAALLSLTLFASAYAEGSCCQAKAQGNGAPACCAGQTAVHSGWFTTGTPAPIAGACCDKNAQGGDQNQAKNGACCGAKGGEQGAGQQNGQPGCCDKK